MAKIWKVVAIIVVVAIIFAAICLLVGRITGGDVDYIVNQFKATHDLNALRDSFMNTYNNIYNTIFDTIRSVIK